MKKLKYSTLLIFVFFMNHLAGQDIVINEFMSSNQTTIQDIDGDFPDWIELYNKDSVIANLEGYFISDDTLAPAKWKFPAIHLSPEGFLLIFASDKDCYDTTELHTNFKISASGEHLVLCDPDTIPVDITEPAQVPADKTYGRFPDGEDDLMLLSAPTPRMANLPGTMVFFSKPAGFYNQEFNLFIGSENPDDTVYYTLDGSLPNIESEVFSDSIPIQNIDMLPNNISMIPTAPTEPPGNYKSWKPPNDSVSKANIVRGVVIRNGIVKSQVATSTYFVDTAIQSKYHFPVISIATGSNHLFNYKSGIYVPGIHWDSLNPVFSGNYFMRGDEWERPAHFEYFTITGERKINQNVGIRIHGKSSRNAPQKTLKLYARSEYGCSYFNYPFMLNNNQDKFKRILLRTTYADGMQTIIKDAMTHDLVKHLNLDLQYYQPVVVFINGEYWGMHTIRDRIDKYYLGMKYDFDPDSVDLLENNAQVIDGSNAAYLEMLAFIKNNDLSDQQNYEYIGTLMDIDNFIDYQIVEIYFGNFDWPGSNIKYWRKQGPGAKWRWILFDLDFCYNDFTFDHLKYVTFEGDTSYQNPSWSTFLFRNLIRNDQFKGQFIYRFADLLNTTFQPDTILAKIDEFENLYSPGIDRHSKRWNFPVLYENWHVNIAWGLKRYVQERPCYMRGFILDYFNLEEDEFPFECDLGNNEPDTKPFIIYPNPARSNLTVELDRRIMTRTVNIEIFSHLGVKILHETISDISGEYRKLLDITEFQPGLYILQISDHKKIWNSKFIKTID